jgi:hypothetical protein
VSAQIVPLHGRRSHRDGSPEQLEAMQHVARECSAIDSALGPLGPKGYAPPEVPAVADASALLLWLAVVVVASLSAWAGIWLGWWVDDAITRWTA